MALKPPASSLHPHLIVALDIDGTLIDLTGAGSRAMNRAFQELLGVSGPPPVSFAGSTDRGIVSSVISTSRGSPPTDRALEELFEHYLQLLPEELERTPYSPTPGAFVLVEMLRKCPTVVVGLATGNIREAARLKLESAGFGWSFDFGAFGDETADRADLVAMALGRGRDLLPPRAKHRAVVIGDTPRDIDAARANHAFSIAVATGPFSLAALVDHAPDRAIDSLTTITFEEVWRSLAKSGSSRR